MIASRDVQSYRRDVHKQGRPLTPKAREELIKPYLPAPPSYANARNATQRKLQLVRTFLKTQLHLLVYTIIHTLFSLYIRLRQTYHAIIDRIFAILYYHHRTPELIQRDVRALSRLPSHLSVILELKEEERGAAGLEALVDDVAEISAWCACVGIPMLSVYERTGTVLSREAPASETRERQAKPPDSVPGILKAYIPTTHRTISSKFHAYFGRRRPSLQIRAPHMPSFLNGDLYDESPLSISSNPAHLTLLLLSSEDGRPTLVDLTKTLTEMSQRAKLSPADISLDLVDAEVSESIMGEPDLLLLFAPHVRLRGYPPWQLRLTEIFHVRDSAGLGYQVFLRALHRFAKVEMRFGR
ncbi:hypothetical protein MMC16_001245 [Acarospora aff. strigata]|nr:hypothetical protein [Acarospora aff. strigata]